MYFEKSIKMLTNLFIVGLRLISYLRKKKLFVIGLLELSI